MPDQTGNVNRSLRKTIRRSLSRTYFGDFHAFFQNKASLRGTRFRKATEISPKLARRLSRRPSDSGKTHQPDARRINLAARRRSARSSRQKAPSHGDSGGGSSDDGNDRSDGGNDSDGVVSGGSIGDGDSDCGVGGGSNGDGGARTQQQCQRKASCRQAATQADR